MIITENHAHSLEVPIVLPRVGDRYRHYKGMEYRVLGIATHGEEDPQYVSYRAIFEPTAEPIYIVAALGDVISYQVPQYPNKDWGALVLYRASNEQFPVIWARPLVSFLSKVPSTTEVSINRFSLIQ